MAVGLIVPHKCRRSGSGDCLMSMLVVWTLGLLSANDDSSRFSFEGRPEMQFPCDHHSSRRDSSNKAQGETRRVSRALLLPWVLGPYLSVSPNGTALIAQVTFFRAATSWLPTIGSLDPGLRQRSLHSH